MIVSNTTPLSCLLKIEKAQVLQALYGSITIPSEVAAELDQAGAIHDGWRQQLDFVQVADPITGDPVFTLLMADLDPGEAAAITWYKHRQAQARPNCWPSDWNGS